MEKIECNKPDNCFCNREYEYNNKTISCSDIAKILKKSYAYVELNKKHKSFLQTLNKNRKVKTEYIEAYKTEHKKKVKEYVRTMNIYPLKDFINTYEELHPYN